MKWILLAVFGLLPPGAPGVESAPQAPVARSTATLLRAHVEVEPRSATRARVSAAFEIDGEDTLELMLVWFVGQEVTELELRDQGRPVPALLEVDSTRVARIRLAGGAGRSRSLYLDYEIEVPETAAYRYPLPVPSAAADPAVAAIAVEVLLPTSAVYRGDRFPALQPAGERRGRQLLRTQPAGVPSFVHVEFGDEGSRITTPDRIQLLVFGLALLLLSGLGLRALRRRHHVSGLSP